jgi:mannose-6-phosphate isomerase-like protein (cupin superfamily)
MAPAFLLTGRSDRRTPEGRSKGMEPYVDDIEEATEGNEDFRRVLYTGTHLQLVLMALQPGETIGETTHEDRDQFFCVEEGEGEIVIDGSRHPIEDDFAALVPAGASYDVINTGDEPLKLYALCAPPDEQDEVVHRNSAEAEESESETPG